jgi:hypothetical protein
MSTYVLEQTVPLRTHLLSRALGVISVAGMALPAIPPSSIAGAMLWVGYFGNVVVTHLNMMQA